MIFFKTQRLCIALLFVSTCVTSNVSWADEAVSRLLQAKLSRIQTMQASFKQTVRAKQRVLSNSSGSMALSRPGKFRWDTHSPMKQHVIADGQRIWVYDVDLEQVSVKPQNDSLGETAGLFLSGYNDKAAKSFEVSLKQSESEERFDLSATSDKAGVQRVILIFSGELLRGMELFDQLGQRTTVSLFNVKLNSSLPSSTFSFHPPKGVDVVTQ